MGKGKARYPMKFIYHNGNTFFTWVFAFAFVVLVKKESLDASFWGS